MDWFVSWPCWAGQVRELPPSCHAALLVWISPCACMAAAQAARPKLLLFSTAGTCSLGASTAPLMARLHHVLLPRSSSLPAPGPYEEPDARLLKLLSELAWRPLESSLPEEEEEGEQHAEEWEDAGEPQYAASMGGPTTPPRTGVSGGR